MANDHPADASVMVVALAFLLLPALLLAFATSALAKRGITDDDHVLTSEAIDAGAWGLLVLFVGAGVSFFGAMGFVFSAWGTSDPGVDRQLYLLLFGGLGVGLVGAVTVATIMKVRRLSISPREALQSSLITYLLFSVILVFLASTGVGILVAPFAAAFLLWRDARRCVSAPSGTGQ